VGLMPQHLVVNRVYHLIKWVGRPGLDPGTLGLRGTLELLRGVGLVAHVAEFQGIALSRVGLVAWCSRNMRH
jgi:hypothetical protein